MNDSPVIPDFHCGFEGPEKLLEIWFRPSSNHNSSSRHQLDSSRGKSLRSIDIEVWKQMLRLVKCEIISVIRNDHVDAYLLSESSMFVFDCKIILKTCGTTTLLACLPMLFRLAFEHLFKPIAVDSDIIAEDDEDSEYYLNEMVERHVDYIFYSRKSFMFPNRQLYPHTDWTDEVACLQKYFSRGSAYVVGKTNREHWYCFLWEQPPVPSVIGSSPQINNYCNNNSNSSSCADNTLEILMCDLDPDVNEMLIKDHAYTEHPVDPNNSVPTATQLLQHIYPCARIDDYIFDPCGYSCNGLTTEGGYFTVHVTPEPHCSYASFETNIQPPNGPASFSEVIAKIVGIFRPRKFTVTLFAEKQLPHYDGDSWVDAVPDERHLKGYAIGKAVKGYQRLDRIIYEFDNYDLFFYHYDRDSVNELSLSRSNESLKRVLDR